jgi:hypothetical protein
MRNEGTTVFTNLPPGSFDYRIVNKILTDEFNCDLVFDKEIEVWRDTTNVYFKCDDERSKQLIPAINALYRALLNIEMVINK